MVDAVGARTKIVYVCLPNNPTGTTNSARRARRVFRRGARARADRHRPGVLRVRRRSRVPRRGRGVLQGRGTTSSCLRTFSKIYGLAGLRVGYGVGPEAIVAEIGKVRRAFDLTTSGQEAALASLGDDAELGRRRRANADAIRELERILRAHGLEPVEARRRATSSTPKSASDAATLFDRLLREGVIVRPLRAFGAPDAVRITAGAARGAQPFWTRPFQPSSAAACSVRVHVARAVAARSADSRVSCVGPQGSGCSSWRRSRPGSARGSR